MNPVKANIVKIIADYPWSSYRHNALGKKNSLITEHKLYKNLGERSALRAENYQKIFDALNTDEQEQQSLQRVTVQIPLCKMGVEEPFSNKTSP